MWNRIALSIAVTLVVGAGLFVCMRWVSVEEAVYANLFRLTAEQVTSSLAATHVQCTTIRTCALLPGDILIRRYITKRTWLFDTLAHPFFTHVAYYVGGDQIVEAVGTEKQSKDDIQVTQLSGSDWFNDDVRTFVIMRPKDSESEVADMSSALIRVANDPDYTFGLPEVGHKRTTCADLVYEQLRTEDLVTSRMVPEIITPDYLYWATRYGSKDFDVLGYSFQ